MGRFTHGSGQVRQVGKAELHTEMTEKGHMRPGGLPAWSSTIQATLTPPPTWHLALHAPPRLTDGGLHAAA